MKSELRKKQPKKGSILHQLTDTTVDFDLRIIKIIAYSGAVGNTLGFLANFLLYGMNFPTAFCALCALLILLNVLFGLNGRHYRVFGWAMIILLDLLEFPFLVFTYGAVMYPYLVLGFIAMLMLATGKKRFWVTLMLTLYDVAIIILSSLNPYIFGPQDDAGLMGSAIATFVIALTGLTGCVLAWQSVSVSESSNVDFVSGALTRSGFMNSAAYYLTGEAAERYAVICFNIKSFKLVNAVFGNEGGNRLLRRVSEHLRNSPLQPVLTAKVNTDRFMCLVDRDNLKYGELNRICEFDFTENGKRIPLVLHSGVFLVDGPDSPETMCEKAAIAMRYVRVGQNQHYAVFDETSLLTYKQETELLSELDEAIRTEVFEPYYQPIVDCRTGRIVSAEALVRWNHPQKGLLVPGVFIPILEKRELISSLDSIMINKVCGMIQERDKAGKDFVPISINLSRMDLYNTQLLEQIRKVIYEKSSDRVHFRFEITESSFESLPEDTFNLISDFRRMGNEILMDDFGTGYSCLSMLNKYAFDYIKLDMTFARGLIGGGSMCNIVRSIIEMAHSIGAKVIMEGVEYEEQYKFLQECGCDQIQGYYFYKPMSQKDFLDLLDRQ